VLLVMKERRSGKIGSMASTGGQIMPSIMGAAAFILAQTLWISYWKVAAVIGYFFRAARPWERYLLFIGAILLIVPEIITDFIGMALVGGIILVQIRRPSDLRARKPLPAAGVAL
jgi:TRAP-type uncharacterized transport system fused permease subunit